MQVCFKLQVCEGIGTSSGDAWFSRLIELPFVPPIGMEVIDGGWSATVDSLAYRDGVVFAFVEKWSTKKYRTAEEMAAEIAEAEENGWIRSEGVLSV